MAEGLRSNGFLVRAWFLLASEPFLSALGLFVAVPLAADFAVRKAQKRGWV